MFAHADDASVSDGPVLEATQIIVPLWKRLPSSRLPAVSLCLLDEVARPILGAAEQLLLLQICFWPNSRYQSNLVRDYTDCFFRLKSLLCSMLGD